METITKDALQQLLSDEAEGPHVSIYMPTVQAGQQTQQNPIRFKNLVREAETRLRKRGMSEHEADLFLTPALRMIQDNEFWQHQDAGLAMFVAEHTCKDYRLPVEFQELAVVQDRFYVKPLLPALSHGERFYILALSQNHVRLFDCGRRSARELELHDVPHSLADALGHQLTDPEMAYQSATRPSQERAGPPNHQGQVASAADYDFKSEIHRFFERLNPGLKKYLHDGCPLVLAGVEYLLPIYRQTTDYEPIVGTITGNFDVERPQTVHERAWPIVEPYFTQVRKDALARYGELSDTQRIANGLEEIVLAAIDGRIDTLFIARDAQRWGSVDSATRKAQVRDEPRVGDAELLDLAAGNTFLQGGRVFVLAPEQVPDGQSQAAILRY